MATYLVVDALLDKPELYEEYKLKANRFYESAEYLAVLPVSMQSARRTVIMLEGL